MVIEEVPVSAPGVFDVGTHRDQTSSRNQRAMRLFDRPFEGNLGGQMFEEVAGEYYVEAAVGNLPRFRTVLLEECYLTRCELPGVRIQVHPELTPGPHGIDELTVAAA